MEQVTRRRIIGGIAAVLLEEVVIDTTVPLEEAQRE